MRDEIQQRKPFRSRRQEGAVALLRTADRLRRTLAAVVEPHGITLQQYNVLRILRGAAGEALPTLDIAGRMVEHSPGITRLLDRLERKRLVRRERCVKDRRRVLCRITRGGRTLLASLDEAFHAAEDRLLGVLPPADLERLIGALDALRAPRGD